jgi:hypothetical protein
MTEVEFGTVTLTGDHHGFLSRRCPNCSRVFKRAVVRITAGELPARYCPYCARANEDDWYTVEQRAYVQAAIERAAMKYATEQVTSTLEGLNSEYIEFKAGSPQLPPDPGAPPSEPEEGFIRADVPCHEDDPFMVAVTTTGQVACSVCGIPYDVGEVAQLGSE